METNNTIKEGLINILSKGLEELKINQYKYEDNIKKHGYRVTKYRLKQYYISNFARRVNLQCLNYVLQFKTNYRLSDYKMYNSQLYDLYIQEDYEAILKEFNIN